MGSGWWWYYGKHQYSACFELELMQELVNIITLVQGVQGDHSPNSGQRLSLQLSDISSCSRQSLSGWKFLGQTHSLRLERVPPPQVREHSDQSDQGVRDGHGSSLQAWLILSVPSHCWTDLTSGRTHSRTLNWVPPPQLKEREGRVNFYQLWTSSLGWLSDSHTLVIL